MDKKHILKLGNINKIMDCLNTVLSNTELDKIRSELNDNLKQIISLSNAHLNSAKKIQGSKNWRQKVSRAYYACYIASRGLRLAVYGNFNTESSDHNKIGHLPDDFPDTGTWRDFLTKLRADRNLADYDHTVGAKSLEMPSTNYIDNSKRFVHIVKDYLKSRGWSL